MPKEVVTINTLSQIPCSLCGVVPLVSTGKCNAYWDVCQVEHIGCGLLPHHDGYHAGPEKETNE